MICSLFLNPQGKIIADSFITKTAPGYLIEIGDKSYQDVINLFQKRKLSADVSFEPLRQDVYQVLPPLNACHESFEPREGEIDRDKFEDPRHKTLGFRLYPQGGSLEKLSKNEYEFQSLPFYWIVLRFLGIVEDIGFKYGKRLVPHDVNLDTSVYISRDKGCYTGQEIVNKLRNKTLFPRYKLVPGFDAYETTDKDEHDELLKNLPERCSLPQDLLIALIKYCKNGEIDPNSFKLSPVPRG